MELYASAPILNLVRRITLTGQIRIRFRRITIDVTIGAIRSDFKRSASKFYTSNTGSNRPGVSRINLCDSGAFHCEHRLFHIACIHNLGEACAAHRQVIDDETCDINGI